MKKDKEKRKAHSKKNGHCDQVILLEKDPKDS